MCGNTGYILRQGGARVDEINGRHDEDCKHNSLNIDRTNLEIAKNKTKPAELFLLNQSCACCGLRVEKTNRTRVKYQKRPVLNATIKSHLNRHNPSNQLAPSPTPNLAPETRRLGTNTSPLTLTRLTRSLEEPRISAPRNSDLDISLILDLSINSTLRSPRLPLSAHHPRPKPRNSLVVRSRQSGQALLCGRGLGFLVWLGWCEDPGCASAVAVHDGDVAVVVARWVGP